MKHNMGTADRIIRAVIGVVLAYIIFTGKAGGALAVILGIVALAMVVTALVGFCPPYALLGIKTCRCDEHGGEGSSQAH